MRYKYLWTLLISLLFTASVQAQGIPDNNHDYLVTLKTDYGDIKIILYDDIPMHKMNFIELAKAGVYDHVTFHRVINNFMIQTGDPSTCNQDKDYDPTIISKTIPAEIRHHHKHVKGAVGAARRGDKVNPMKKSSGTQFYIVQNARSGKHLDGEYTVFGKVMSGLNVVDKIAAVKTNEQDKPLKDVRMTVEVETVKRSDIEKFYSFEYKN